ncbi:hypothetical protein [Joostella sp. CR20]|uniref:hypothetical protein n=1 Tax=Joostella sp. CR20 TaxID=2804312 RepID=UPI00313B6FED
MRLPLLLFFCVQFTMAQNQLRSKLLDSATNAPIEFADVYNYNNYTTTNADGSFLFTSEKDSVFIKYLGYKPIRSTFTALNKQDIIYMVEETYELEPVIVSTKKSIYKNIVDQIESNYALFPYEERFTLRAFLKKNDTVLKLQDLTGKLRRKQLFGTEEQPMPRKNYEVELLNMRKAGLKEEDVEFMLGDFPKILDWFILHAKLKEDKYDIKTGAINDTVNLVEFTVKDSIVNATFSNNKGYLKVNSKNNAMLENYLILERNTAKYEKTWIYKYRTTFMKMHAFYEKASNKKYFLKNAKVEANVEVINTETNKTDIYNCSYIITTQDNFKELNTKRNVSINRDIFKLKYPYNPAFWDGQNELLLTEEMLEFLKTVNADENEYRAVSNLK